MLERFVIFSRTGIVLFSLSFSVLKADPLPALIRDSLLTQHVPRGVASFEFADYSVKWTEAALQEVVFAAVLDRAVAGQVRYIETLLASVKDVFLQKYGAAHLSDPSSLASQLPATSVNARRGHESATDNDEGEEIVVTEDVFGFKPLFDGLLDAAEKSAGSSGGIKAMRGGAGGGAGGSGKGAAAAPAASLSTPIKEGSDEDDNDNDNDGNGSGHGDGDKPEEEDDDDREMAAARAALMSKMAKGGRGGPGVGGSKKGTPASNSKQGNEASSSSNSKPRKGLASSMPLDFKYSKDLEKSLDRTSSAGGSVAAEKVEKVEFRFDGSTGKDLDDSDAELIAAATAAALAGSGSAATAAGAGSSSSSFSSSSSSSSSGGKGGGGGMFSSAANWLTRSKAGTFLSSLTGNKVLDRADLEPVMEQLKQQLIGRNVAREAADALCESVIGTLEGKKLEVAGSVAATVGSALTTAIERILTPRRPIDLLAEVRAKKASGSGSPFVICFVGVNGVGKSTSLSKVAYHLKDNRHSVLIAACDSFRAGAVEQLKRHCTALDIPLYEQGYAKDPVSIAAAAIKEAASVGTDVVLVDTAGRMQNNAGLMQQLAKLVAVNKPDLVLFVGEALVGNDGVDQLSEFNKKLVEYASDRTNPRRIDGIMLTKFDTIDDNVGAALSMVYSTGIPVVFLGTGQKYTDLRRLNVGAVVKALMS